MTASTSVTRKRAGVAVLASAIAVVSVIAAVRSRADGADGTRDGVAEWLARWELARGCLLPTGTRETSTGLVIGELSSRRSCMPSIQALEAGPEGEITDAIGTRWHDAVSAVRTLEHGQGIAERAAAIERIDGDAEVLRLSIGALPVARGAQPALRVLPSCAIVVEGQALTKASWLSYNGGQLRGNWFLETQVHHLCEAGSAGVAPPPSPDWFVEPARKDTSRAPADLAPTETVLVLKTSMSPAAPTTRLAVAGDLLVAAASAHAANRLVFLVPYRAQTYPYVLVVSRDFGQHWSVEYPPSGTHLVGGPQQDPRTGTVDLFVRDAHRISLLRFTDASAAPRVVKSELSASESAERWSRNVDVRCRHADALWTLEQGAIQRIDARGFQSLALHDDGYADQIDCRGDTAVVVRRTPDVVERCRGRTCEVVLETVHRHTGSVALLDDGSWIYAVKADGVVGIWREHRAPEFYADTSGRLKAITLSNGKPYLVMVDDDSVYRFLAI